MPIHTGSLTSLAQSPLANLDSNSLCLAFLEQILSALDYLANENLVHRDLKPDNILYSNLSEDRYLFQLADFGLAQYYSLATTLCGTGYYQAPELRLPTLGVKVSQSHKLDIWSLYATTVAVHTRFKEFPPATLEYEVVLDVLKAKAGRSVLKPMARLHPDRRASAAQMLVLLFEGRGLTTPRSKIPPIEPDIDGVP
jgi:serine/threonine protein kinase